MVHYFPNGKDTVAAANGATLVPATVIQPFSSRLNLSVQTMNGDAPVVLRYSVPHKSDLHDGYDAAYWDWPEIK